MRKRSAAFVAAMLAVAMTATACGRDDASDDKGTTKPTTASGESAAFINPDKDCTDYQPTRGIEGDTITVGNVRPTSGPAGVYNIVSTGIEKFFDAQNLKGGIKAGDGKTYKVKVVKGDDGYDPARTPDVVKDLVEQQGIFAMVGEIGTGPNLAVRQYMNDKCVPSVALATGSPEWGSANDFPWFIAGLPSYALEMHAFSDYLRKEKPDAKVAILYQNDDFGESFLGSFKKAIDGSSIKVVGEQSFDVLGGGTTEAATTQLASTGADTFIVGVTGTPCPATLKYIPADWKPLTFVGITCSGKTSMALAGGADEGVYTMQALLDPSNPEDQKNPRTQQFIADATSVGLSQADIEGGIASAGWGFAAIFAEALRLTPKVTRADLMNTLFSLKDVKDFGLTRPGLVVNTDGAKDPWILESLRVVKRESGQWVPVTDLVDYNGKSNSVAAK